MGNFKFIYLALLSIFLNTNAIEIIRQSKTTDDSDDTSQLIVPPFTSKSGSTIINISDAEELTKIANQATKDQKGTSKIIHENIKVTIRKHSKGGHTNDGRVNETHVSYDTWNNLDDSSLNDRGNKVFDYKVSGVTEQGIKEASRHSKSDTISSDYYTGFQEGHTNDFDSDSGLDYIPYYKRHLFKTNEFEKTDDDTTDAIQKVNSNKKKVAENGFNVIERNLITTKVRSGDMTEHDSTGNFQDKTGYDELVSNIISTGSQRDDFHQSLGDNAIENSSTLVSDSINSAGGKNTLINTITKKAADNIIKISINDKRSEIFDDQPDDLTIQNDEFYAKETSINDLISNKDLEDNVSAKNVKNIENFWLLLDEYVYKNQGRNTELSKLEKMFTLLSIFTKLNEVKKTGGKIEIMIDNLINILEQSPSDVKIETENYRYGKTDEDEELINDYNVWPTLNPDVTSFKNKDTLNVEKPNPYHKKMFRKVYSPLFEGAKDVKESGNLDVMSEIHTISPGTESHKPLPPDALVNKDNVQIAKDNKNPNFNGKVNDILISPSNTIINNTEPSEIIETYDQTTSQKNNYPYVNPNSIDRQDVAVTSKSTANISVNVENISNKSLNNYNDIVVSNRDSQIVDKNTSDMYFVPKIPVNTTPKNDVDTVKISPIEDIIANVYENETESNGDKSRNNAEVQIFDDYISNVNSKINTNKVEPSIVNMAPENKPVTNGNPYLFNDFSLDGINVPTNTDSSLEDEKMLGYLELYQYLLQMQDIDFDDFSPEIQTSQSSPDMSILWKELKEKNPELFLPYYETNPYKHELNIRSDSLRRTDATVSNLFDEQILQDSQPDLSGPETTLSPKQNFDSIWSSLSKNISNKNEITTPEPVTDLRTGINMVSNNDMSIQIKHTSAFIDAPQITLEENILRPQSNSKMSYPKSLYENRLINDLIFQNPSTDSTKYLQLLSNLNGNNVQNYFTHDKHEPKSRAYLDLRNRLEIHKVNDNNINAYKNIFPYEFMKQYPYYGTNKKMYKNNIPEYEMRLPDLISFLNKQKKENYFMPNDVTFDGLLNYKLGNKEVISFAKEVNRIKSEKELLDIFGNIKAHLREGGTRDAVIDEIIRKVNHGMPEIEEKNPYTQDKQLVDKIRESVESAVNNDRFRM